MLKQRVITGLVLAGLVVLIIFLLPPVVYLAAMAFVCLAAVWEWTTLAGLQTLMSRVAYTMVGALLMTVVSMQPQWQLVLLWVSVPWWLCMFWLVLQYPERTHWWSGRSAMVISGLVVILPAWAALLLIRQHESFQFLFILMVVLVAFADIGAYFTGRTLGKYKLAVRVSPNKTWEGFAGGVIASTTVMAVAGITIYIKGYLSSPALLMVIIGAACLAMVSVIGDLYESMCKRQRGIKDSGRLLPGHGGMLDRIDGFTAATPLFMLLVMLAEHL